MTKPCVRCFVNKSCVLSISHQFEVTVTTCYLTFSTEFSHHVLNICEDDAMLPDFNAETSQPNKQATSQLAQPALS